MDEGVGYERRGGGEHGPEARGVQHPAESRAAAVAGEGAAPEEEVEREGVRADAPAAHAAEEEDRVVRAGGRAEAGAQGGVEEERGVLRQCVEQAERVAEVARGREAVGEGVEEVPGGGRVSDPAGCGEDCVELERLPHGARRRPWRRHHGTAAARSLGRACQPCAVCCGVCRHGPSTTERGTRVLLGCFCCKFGFVWWPIISSWQPKYRPEMGPTHTLTSNNVITNSVVFCLSCE